MILLKIIKTLYYSFTLSTELSTILNISEVIDPSSVPFIIKELRNIKYKIMDSRYTEKEINFLFNVIDDIISDIKIEYPEYLI